MSKAFFFGAPAHGHTNPTLPVVGELVRRGEDIVYFNTEEFRTKIESTGATFRNYKSYGTNPGTPFPFGAKEIGNIFTLAALVMQGTERLVPGLLDATRHEHPDYIIHDAVSVWGKLIARTLALPAVSSVSTLALGFRSGLFMLRPNLEIARMLPSDPGAPLRYLRAARRLKVKYDRRACGILDVFLNKEDLNLVYTSRLFQPGAHSFPPTYVFVGPSIATPPAGLSAEFPWGLLEGRRVIYIAMGTIFCDVGGFYKTCFDAFRDWDGIVVMSVGPNTDIAALGEAPHNCVVRSHVPQPALLEHTDLFVTHAGMNSASEALMSHVPMVAIPQGADQHTVAHQIRKLRAGVRLNKKGLTAPKLRRAAEKVLADDTYRARSREVGESLRAAGGYKRAADEVLAYYARKRDRH